MYVFAVYCMLLTHSSQELTARITRVDCDPEEPKIPNTRIKDVCLTYTKNNVCVQGAYYMYVRFTSRLVIFSTCLG